MARAAVALGPAPSRSRSVAPAARPSPRILRVTDLNRRVRSLLDADAILADVWVEGEVSQPSFPACGHCFFTLKDVEQPDPCRPVPRGAGARGRARPPTG